MARLPDVFSLQWVRFSPTFIEVWLSGTDRVVYRTYEDSPEGVAATQSMLENDLAALDAVEFQERWGLSE